MTPRLRVVIADDERPARSFLAALLRSFDDVVIVAEAASGKEAVAAIEQEHPDLVFLDLQMPELDGIGVVRLLKKAMPLVAFVTAYDEYAVKAFEVNAVDYLLKPVDKRRLRHTVNRALERLEHAEIVAEQETRVQRAIDEYETLSQPYLERIPSGGGIKSSSSRCHRSPPSSPMANCSISPPSGTNGTRSPTGSKISKSALDPAEYLRLGRGIVVRIDCITKMHVMPGGTHVAFLSNGQKLRVSRLQSRSIRERLLRL